MEEKREEGKEKRVRSPPYGGPKLEKRGETHIASAASETEGAGSPRNGRRNSGWGESYRGLMKKNGGSRGEGLEKASPRYYSGHTSGR